MAVFIVIVRVPLGVVDSGGRSRQCLIFRESQEGRGDFSMYSSNFACSSSF